LAHPARKISLPEPSTKRSCLQRIRISTDRVVHMMTLTAAEDVDDQIRD